MICRRVTGFCSPPQDLQVAQRGEVTVERRLLHHGPHLCKRPVTGLFQRRPEDLHVSFQGIDEMQDHPDRGAFPRAVGTQESKDIAPPDLDVQMVHGQSVFVALGQINGAQNDIGHLAYGPPDSLKGDLLHFH